MAHNTPLAITISRELGSGGAYIGHKIAEALNMYYADQEIITRTAEKLSAILYDIEENEEKITSFWQNFWAKTGIHEFYSEAVGSFSPTTAKIFETEADVILQIVKEQPSVIIGRCGFHILKDYPNTINIYLHGSVDARAERLQKIRKITEPEAKAQLLTSDRERALYIKKFTKKDWADCNNFDLAIDTGKIGFDNATELILKYIHSCR